MSDYKEFVKNELPEDDCRYAVYDFEYEKSPSEGIRNKICFIVWYAKCSQRGIGLPLSTFPPSILLSFPLFRSPDTARVKQKMLYASSKDAIRKKLVGVAAEIQATDGAEISFETIVEKLSSF